MAVLRGCMSFSESDFPGIQMHYLHPPDTLRAKNTKDLGTFKHRIGHHDSRRIRLVRKSSFKRTVLPEGLGSIGVTSI
jgi:hypothetical protein